MLPTPQDINPDFPLPLRGGPGEPLDTERRYFLTFPGVNQVVETGARLIDDPASGFEVRFSLYGPISDGTIVAQNISNNTPEREFQIFYDASAGGLRVVIGGNLVDLNIADLLGDYLVSYDGSNLAVFVNGLSVYNNPVAAGSETEEMATLTIGARHAGTLSAYGFHYTGVIANVRINGVAFYPLDDNSTTIRDVIGGNDGTYINGAAADWGRFERAYGGDWQGQGLTVPPWASADQALPIA